MSLHQSRSLKESVKSHTHSIWLIPICSVLLFKMVNSLQSIVLYSVPIAMLFDMLKMLHHLPMGKDCLRALFKRCTHEELRDWAKTLPWDHPVARALDHEVHRRRMAGESYGFHFFFRVWVPFPYTFFSLKSQTCSRGLIFYEHCCGLSTCVFALDEPDSIGPRGSGSQPVRVDFHFFVRFLGICGESACVSYLPVGRPSHPWRGV